MTENDIPILDKLGVDIGYKTTHVKTITGRDIELFAEVSGDYNPVHIDEEYAQKTLFKGRIAHGAISESLISATMSKLPGLVIYLSTSMRFLKPVRIGDTIAVVADVTEVRKDKGIVTTKNTCTNQNGEVVTEGEGTVRLYEEPA